MYLILIESLLGRCEGATRRAPQARVGAGASRSHAGRRPRREQGHLLPHGRHELQPDRQAARREAARDAERGHAGEAPAVGQPDEPLGRLDHLALVGRGAVVPVAGERTRSTRSNACSTVRRHSRPTCRYPPYSAPVTDSPSSSRRRTSSPNASGCVDEPLPVDRERLGADRSGSRLDGLVGAGQVDLDDGAPPSRRRRPPRPDEPDDVCVDVLEEEVRGTPIRSPSMLSPTASRYASGRPVERERVARVVACQHLEQRGQVGDGARHRDRPCQASR